MRAIIYSCVITLFVFAFTSCDLEEVNPRYDVPTNGITTSDLQIYSNACFAGGDYILIRHPKSNNLDYYADERYIVEWYQDDKFIKNGVDLNCVCGENFMVIVRDMDTGTYAWLRFDASDCPESDVRGG